MPSQENLVTAIQNQLEAGSNFRQPIVDGQLPIAEMQSDWRLVTGVMQRGIAENPAVREALTDFMTTPVSEALPLQAIDKVTTVDERTARVMGRGKGRLGRILGLPEVPDELMTPDLKTAPKLERADRSAYDLAVVYAKTPELLEERIEAIKGDAAKRPGISGAERQLVANRYVYARDIKLLALSAELHDHPFTPTEHGEDLTYQLPSGTTMVIDKAAYETAPGLVDPAQWQKRQQLKDRVHVISVDDQLFLMKERKTPRHVDTKEGGHIESAGSAQEYETAKEFAALGKLDDGLVSASWEKPVGYVEYPDGFQFAVFQAEAGLIDQEQHELLQAHVAQRIVDHREDFTAEYERIKARAAEIEATMPHLLLSRPKRLPEPPEPKRWARFKRTPPATPVEEEFSFETFARFKATYLRHQAQGLLSATIHEHGYINSDQDGYGFRLKPDGQPGLEIVGFDFEYYEMNEPEAQRLLSEHAQDKADGEWAWRYMQHYTGLERIDVAASFAMVEEMGGALPPAPEVVIDESVVA